MITKESLQKFVDDHINEIKEVLPGGLKNKDGKWILICPVMERFNLDFSKVNANQEITEDKPKKTTKKKTKTK